MDDAARLPLTLRAHGYRLLVKPLPPFKMKVANTTFILIDRHYFTSRQLFLTHFTAVALLRQIQIAYQPEMAEHFLDL
jgi:hypothetical protein